MKDSKMYIVFLVLCVFFLFFGLFFAFFPWSAQQHYLAKDIEVRKIQLPAEYVNLTAKVQHYSDLLEAIKLVDGKFESEISSEEFFELKKVINSSYIRVGENHYRIELFRAIGVRKLDSIPESYVNVSTEIDPYPSLKK